jgi:hypothetical protein
VAKWNAEWLPIRVDLSTAGGLDELETHRAALTAATLKPDFASDLVDLAESHAMRGDVATALRAANLGHEIYPRSSGLNGVLGVLTLLSGGDAARAKSLLTKSAQLDATGYARAGNLLNIANFLARGDSRPAAIALLQIASELHPANEPIRARLAELAAR